MTSDEAFLSYSGGILNNCLTNILHINENETDINEQQTIRRSSYYDFYQFSKLAKKKLFYYFKYKYSVSKFQVF